MGEVQMLTRIRITTLAVIVALVMGFTLSAGTQQAYAKDGLQANGIPMKTQISSPTVGEGGQVTVTMGAAPTVVPLVNETLQQTGKWDVTSHNDNIASVKKIAAKVSQDSGNENEESGNYCLLTIEGKKVGQTKIDVTFTTAPDDKSDSKSQTTSFTVNVVYPNSVMLKQTVEYGKSLDLSDKYSTESETKISYDSSDDSIATVSEKGVINTVKPGHATITLTTAGNDSSSAASTKIDLTVEKGTQAITTTGKVSPLVYGGKTAKIGASAKTGITYKPEKNGIVTIKGDGTITAVKPGTTNVIVTAEETDYYKGATKKIPVKVNLGSQTVTFKNQTVKASLAKVKKANTTVALKSAATVKPNGTQKAGAITYKKTSGNGKITVAKNGKITVKKGLKKGTYKVKVTATAAKTAYYNAGSMKNVVVTVQVK